MSSFEQKSKTAWRTSSTRAEITGRQNFRQSRIVNSILRSQRTVAKQAAKTPSQPNTENAKYYRHAADIPISDHEFNSLSDCCSTSSTIKRSDSASLSNIHAAGGLKPSVEPSQEDELVGGRTAGEFVGDIARPVGTAVGNVVGSITGAVTGVSISSNTNSGPTWSNHGHFDWRVGFSTSGRNGWIVQEIRNTYRAVNSTGNDVTPAYTPHYWEAWAVGGSGNITPNVGLNHDYWIRPSRGNNTEGHWSMRGKVHFTKTDPATQGFTPGGVPDAGILLSTTSSPSGLGIARLQRYAQGNWDSTGSSPTHSGSAGP